MNIQRIEISKLNPAKYNPRKDLKPEDEEYQKIKRSLIEFGYVAPIIINSDMTVIAGHQRLKVLKELEFKEVECNIVELDKSKEKALNIALNKIAGKWDDEKLEELFNDLMGKSELDLSITGFDKMEIEDLINELDVRDEDFLSDTEITKSKDNTKEIECPHCGRKFMI